MNNKNTKNTKNTKNSKTNLLNVIYILLAGILWGCMGLFVRPLSQKGLNSWDIVFLRAVLTAVCMGIFLLIYDRRLFRIKLKDIWCFLGTGLLSIVFSTSAISKKSHSHHYLLLPFFYIQLQHLL